MAAAPGRRRLANGAIVGSIPDYTERACVDTRRRANDQGGSHVIRSQKLPGTPAVTGARRRAARAVRRTERDRLRRPSGGGCRGPEVIPVTREPRRSIGDHKHVRDSQPERVISQLMCELNATYRMRRGRSGMLAVCARPSTVWGSARSPTGWRFELHGRLHSGGRELHGARRSAAGQGDAAALPWPR